ncbi:hypothetical protein ACJJTC_011701 [Scirpophaga incertulas]
MGYRRDSRQEKFKVLNDVMRPAPEIGPRCFSKFCTKSKLRGCNNIVETERQGILLVFWKQMDWSQRQQRSKNSVRYWIERSEKRMTRKQEVTLPLKETRSKYCVIFLNKFLDDLPKMPYHYCQASSIKLYLKPVVQSKLKLYKLYCEKCNEQQEKPTSRWLFDQIFNKKNLSLFSPKKDQCDLCCSHDVGNISEAKYREHILKKDRARQEKTQDKLRITNKEVHVFTHDLQSVQLCPKLEASAIYYKTKLCVHNFTIYNLENKDVHCYWFDECTAGLVASVYTTCIIDCLKKRCLRSCCLILYSDGCATQNRNAVLSNALLESAMDYNIQIKQKVLEKGHTQMEHSAQTKLYQSRISISQIKWSHLQELKRVIPSDCHSFYDGLPHK